MSNPIYTTLLAALAALVLAGCGQREDSHAHHDDEEAAHAEGGEAEHHDEVGDR